MHARRRCLALALLLPALLTAGCARSLSVSSEPGPIYSIQVDNQTAIAMIVSYEDDLGTGLLGTVQAGRSERFIIAQPAALAIRVSARSADGARSAGPYPVSLVAGVPQPVTLR